MLLGGAGLLLAGGVACTPDAKPKANQCAVVLGGGAFDARSVKRVAHPGETVDKDGDDEDYFFPCGERNYIITPPNDQKYGDRHTPIEAVLGSAEGAGVPVKVWLRIDWKLNQSRANDDAILKQFFTFCHKFACYSEGADDAAKANFSTPGWNGMLRESMNGAIDRAIIAAAGTLPSNLWEQPSEWAKLGKAAEALFHAEVTKTTGGHQFYCSALVDTEQACPPPAFSIDRVDAPAEIVALRNNQTRIRQESLNKQAEIAERQAVLEKEREFQRQQAELYKMPGYIKDREHEHRLAEIQACKAAGATCVISLGGQSGDQPVVVAPSTASPSIASPAPK